METIKKRFLVKEPQSGIKTIPMVGLRFGKLIVLSWEGLNKQKNKIWLCQCDCGNTTIVSTTQLRQGKTTSCKCNQYKKSADHYNYKGYKDLTGAKWYSIGENAKTRNLEFNITKEYVWFVLENQQFKCSLTGLPISFKDNTASVDRVDNAVGYVESNIQIVHKDVNLMRNKFTISYFIEICGLVAMHAVKA
jgi:hypothetical protein